MTARVTDADTVELRPHSTAAVAVAETSSLAEVPAANVTSVGVKVVRVAFHTKNRAV